MLKALQLAFLLIAVIGLGFTIIGPAQEEPVAISLFTTTMILMAVAIGAVRRALKSVAPGVKGDV